MSKKIKPDGNKNRAGKHIAALRKAKRPKMSQNDLAIQVQLQGILISKNTVQQIEHGHRLLKDYELYAFAKALDVTTDELLNDSDAPTVAQ